MTKKAKRSLSNGLIFWAVVLIGVLPMVAAWYLVNHPGFLGTPGNHGTLIDPPEPVSYDLFQPVANVPSRPLKEIRGRWVLIHWLPERCDKACRENLADTGKLHVLLNKDIPRVRRMVIWADNRTPKAETLETLGEDEHLYLAQVPPAFLERLEKKILAAPSSGGQVILMDPLGNLMMWYDSQFDPFGLYHDLRRLLRASRIG
ncbi:MAG: SCO family protein [Methylohalobius sp. ZOD2]|nr:hypothetical protein [Methylothermaceae bacterium]